LRRASGLASLALRSRLSALLAAVGELGFELLHLTAELFDLAERLRGAFIILARPGLGAFAERLLDFDERMQLFRFHHLKLAERIIGGRVVGTMGTPVEVLQQRMESWLYKDLWDVRNQITAAANEAQGAKQY